MQALVRQLSHRLCAMLLQPGHQHDPVAVSDLSARDRRFHVHLARRRNAVKGGRSQCQGADTQGKRRERQRKLLVGRVFRSPARRRCSALRPSSAWQPAWPKPQATRGRPSVGVPTMPGAWLFGGDYDRGLQNSALPGCNSPMSMLVLDCRLVGPGQDEMRTERGGATVHGTRRRDSEQQLTQHCPELRSQN